MGQRVEITDLDLLAYADGRLDARRAREVAAYLEAHPELREKIEDFAAQNAEMRDRFDHYLDQPLPDALSALIAGEARPRERTQLRRWGPQLAAACVLMGVTGATGWWIGTMDQPGDQAMSRFLDEAAGVHMVGAGEAAGTYDAGEVVATKPLHWLSDRVSLELNLPDMGPHGYELVDQRLVDFQDTQGLVLQYRSEGGERLNVFMKTRWDDDSNGYQFATMEGLEMAFWRQGPLAVAVASDKADRDSLGVAARAVHDALQTQEQPERPREAPALMPSADPNRAQEAGVSPQGGRVSEPAISPTSASSNGPM